jgi:hypothetical protein
MTKKERKAEYDKAWRENNKAWIAAYNKSWNKANKEKIAAQKKVWGKANKEKIAAQKKVYQESKKDGLFTVYLLVNENYVGQTNNLFYRLIHHKNIRGRDVSNVQIIGKYKTREQAMEIEAGYHARGYLGANNNL